MKSKEEPVPMRERRDSLKTIAEYIQDKLIKEGYVFTPRHFDIVMDGLYSCYGLASSSAASLPTTDASVPENNRKDKYIEVLKNEIKKTKEQDNNGWISVEKEPEKEGRYLVSRFGDQFVRKFLFNRWRSTNELVGKDEDGISGSWVDRNNCGVIIDFWMPLPTPPKETNNVKL